jgi:hypothetical protein
MKWMSPFMLLGFGVLTACVAPKLAPRGISSADVRWFCALFARLNDRQLEDAFRAAGYSQDVRARYINKIKSKISPGLNNRTR